MLSGALNSLTTTAGTFARVDLIQSPRVWSLFVAGPALAKVNPLPLS
jgi:hypothetical protein